MAYNSFKQLDVTNAGLTYSTTSAQFADLTYITIAANLVLVDNVDISTSDIPLQGQSFTFVIGGAATVVDLNGNYFRINGFDISAEQLRAGVVVFCGSNGTDFLVPIIISSQDTSASISALDGKYLVDASVTLAKLTNLTSANLIVGNGSNIPTAVAMSGDVTMTNAGVTAIGAGVVVNADVNASAAIARTKLASGTASYIVANDGSGVMTDQQYVTKAQGGFGQNVAAATGFTTFSSGTLSIDAIAEVVTLQVSWETGFVGDFKVKMPFAGTVTEIYAFLDKAIGALDATVTPKNNSGTTMSSGVLTFTASDPKGTAQTSSPSANNTFVATDVLTFTTAGGSAAGVATLSIKVTRTS